MEPQGTAIDGGVALAGMLSGQIECEHPDNAIISGVSLEPTRPARRAHLPGYRRAGRLRARPRLRWERQENGLWRSQPFYRPNGVVKPGMGLTIDRIFGLTAGLTTTAQSVVIADIGIAEDNTAVTFATLFLGGTAAAILSGGTQNGVIKGIGAVTTVAATGSLATNGATGTAGATFTDADMAGRKFAIHKVGFLTVATDTGGAGALYDVIGGSSVTAPYNVPFTLDLTSAGTFSLTLNIQLMAAAQ